jgi:hypothetical protein
MDLPYTTSTLKIQDIGGALEVDASPEDIREGDTHKIVRL